VGRDRSKIVACLQQCLEAAADVAKKIPVRPEVMIPLVGFSKEFELQAALGITPDAFSQTRLRPPSPQVLREHLETRRDFFHGFQISV
jgi:hypothetical protein